ATSCSGGAAAESVLSYGTSTSTNDMGAPLSLFGTSVVCGTMGATTHLARRPGAGAVPGRWGACWAVRTPPAAVCPAPFFRPGATRLLHPHEVAEDERVGVALEHRPERARVQHLAAERLRPRHRQAEVLPPQEHLVGDHRPEDGHLAPVREVPGDHDRAQRVGVC